MPKGILQILNAKAQSRKGKMLKSLRLSGFALKKTDLRKPPLITVRRIARHLKIAPHTVALWVADVAEALPNAPMPEEVKEAEMDEIFTFIGDKKTESIF